MTETTPAADPTPLLHRAADGDQHAWRELVARYTPLLRARANRYRLQEADARDAMQNTWLHLAEHLLRVRDPQRLAGWLATTMSRECLAALRADVPVDATDRAEPVDPDLDPGERVAEAVGRADAAAAVRRAVADLPEPRRRLVRALFVTDRPRYAEIARECGIPVGSIGPTRARILERLRVALDGTDLAQRPERSWASIAL